MRTIRFWIVGLLVAVNCSAATYYVDFAGGSDANSGNSQSAPWKHHPYMTGWTGSYSHSGGDRFIFKGGVTWDHTCFGGTVVGPSSTGFALQAGGSPGASDYYGVDTSWYAGGSWAQPVFDGGYISSNIFVLNEQSYVTIDNLEIKRILCGSAAYEGLIYGYASTNILIENCNLHGWQVVSSIGADDAHGAVIMYFSNGDSQAGNTLTNCTISNLENATTPAGQSSGGGNGQNSQNGEAVREVETISNCTIHDVSSAIVFTGICHNNTIYNVSYPNNNFDYDSATFHENGIYLDNGGSSTLYCYDNYLYNVGGGANCIYPNPHGQTQYIYNNVIYGVQSEQLAIEIDPYEYGSEGGGSCYVFNNTIVNYANGVAAVHVVPRPDPINTLAIVNNLVIYPSSGTITDGVSGGDVSNLSVSHNIAESASTAASQGYTLSNLYAPTSSSDPTVNAGISESGTFTTDILGVSRTQGAGWDIGAYELVGGAPPPSAPVITSALSASGTTNSAFSYAVSASNSPTSYNASPLPSGLSINTSSGAVTGTPSVAGSTNVTISATNAGGTGSGILAITVSAAVVAPAVTSALTVSGTVGSPCSYTITGSNSPTSYNAISLPAGLSVNAGNGVISGTPTTAGSGNVTISASNSGGTGTATLAYSFSTAVVAPVITSALTISGTVGSPISYTITGSNGPTSYNAISLPAGLSVNAGNGVISGTPTTAGSGNVTISASNSGGTGTATLAYSFSTAVVAPAITSALTISGTVGSPISYTITGSNSPTSYNAISLPAGLSVNAGNGVISGTPTTAGSGNVTISASNSGGTGTATLAYSFSTAVVAPVITSALTVSGTVGSPISYAIAGTNSPTRYNATSLPAGLSLNTVSGLISGTPTAAGSSNVTISASNAGGTGSATLSFSFSPAVIAPTITSGLTVSGTVGSPLSYAITGTNSPTGYNATSLPSGLTLNTFTGLISGTPTAPGSTNVTIGASNSGGTGSATLAITLSPAVVAPTITSGLAVSGTVGSPFSYAITGSDGPTSYNATSLPVGLSVNASNGVISGIPSGAGVSHVTISASNTGGTGTATLTITVSTAVVAPVITSTLAASGTVGATFAYSISASNGPTSYSATSLPAGLSVNTSTGAITGTPTAAGTTSVTIRASNSGGTGSATLSITVSPAAVAPVITSGLTVSGTVGSPFSYAIAGSNSPTSYNAISLPPGLTVNPFTGLITGNPSSSGTTHVAISATNAGGTGSATLTITISTAIVAPVVTSALTASGTVGTAFGYSIAASNGPTTYNATSLPAGLSVNTFSGAITGMPSIAGTSYVTISATNAGGTGSAILTLTVSPAAVAPVITSGLTASGTAGFTFSYSIMGSNSPTSYNAVSLPAGLAFNASTGVISGTPSSSGVSHVTISATNAGGTGSATLTITVSTAVVAPVITSALTASGTAGMAFGYSISASNGPTSYNAMSLPAGLSVNSANGAITGTPTVAGTAYATISATNSGGTGYATFVITISPAAVAPVITSVLTASGTVGFTFSYSIVGSNSPTSYATTPLPGGLSLNSSTGVISGTPSVSGISHVTISAANAGGTGSAVLTITVSTAAVTPVVTSPLTASGKIGFPFVYTITGSNGATSYNASSLPPGLSVDTISGAITGTPTVAGTTDVTISATNAGGTGSSTLAITVSSPVVAPVITSAPTASGTVGTPFGYSIAGSNIATGYSAAPLPDGLVVNTSNGSITGTPTSAGTTYVTISATNAGGTGTETLTITIAAAASGASSGAGTGTGVGPSAIASALSAFATVGTPFTYSIIGSNGPTSYSAAPLPAGLTLNANTGSISGTPSAAGTTSVSIGAGNSFGTGTATLVITVVAAGQTVANSTSTSWLVDLSARAYVKSGPNSLVAGFVTSGTSPKSLLIRGVGPTLSNFSISNFLADPQLTLFDSSGTTMTAITSWQAALQAVFQSVGAFSLSVGSTDAAFVQTVNPGAYTVQVDSATSNSGIALAELFDLNPGDATNRLINISARALVGTGGDILIGGFVIGGTTPETLLVRADGPALGGFGVAGFLPNPVLTIYDSNGQIVASIVGWGAAAINSTGPGFNPGSGMSISSATLDSFASVGAFPLTAGSADSALVVSLPAGAYTAQVTDQNGGSGVGLVEIYEAQ